MKCCTLACLVTIKVWRFLDFARNDIIRLAFAMVCTRYDSYVEDAAELFCREWEERLERHCKRCAYLERNVQDRSSPVHVCLCNFPWLGVSEILVSETGNVHGLLEGLAELVAVQIALHLLLEWLDLRQSLCIHSLRLEVCRHLAVKILMRKNHSTVHEVSEDSHKFTVVARLEVLP